MCILFHDWRIIVATPSKYVDEWGEELTAYEIQQKCTDCSKIRYKLVWDCPGYRSEMIEIRMLNKK